MKESKLEMMDVACATKIVQKCKSQTILEGRKKNCGIQVLGLRREKLFTYPAIQKKGRHDQGGGEQLLRTTLPNGTPKL